MRNENILQQHFLSLWSYSNPASAHVLSYFVGVSVNGSSLCVSSVICMKIFLLSYLNLCSVLFVCCSCVYVNIKIMLK